MGTETTTRLESSNEEKAYAEQRLGSIYRNEGKRAGLWKFHLRVQVIRVFFGRTKLHVKEIFLGAVVSSKFVSHKAMILTWRI